MNVENPIAGYELGLIMSELGLLPPETADITIQIPADGAMQMIFTVNLLPKDLIKLATAFQQLQERREAAEIERQRIANISFGEEQP